MKQSKSAKGSRIKAGKRPDTTGPALRRSRATACRSLSSSALIFFGLSTIVGIAIMLSARRFDGSKEVERLYRAMHRSEYFHTAGRKSNSVSRMKSNPKTEYASTTNQRRIIPTGCRGITHRKSLDGIAVVVQNPVALSSLGQSTRTSRCSGQALGIARYSSILSHLDYIQ